MAHHSQDSLPIKVKILKKTLYSVLPIQTKVVQRVLKVFTEQEDLAILLMTIQVLLWLSQVVSIELILLNSLRDLLT
jgi:hypothetical protein